MAESNVFQEFKRVSPTTIQFRMAPTDVAFANTLRRLILTGVETVAFRSDMNEFGKTTDVSVLRNSTPMTNEMLADRIGLLPITVKNPLDWDPDKYIFRLSITNDSADLRDVLASDIEVFEKGEDGQETKVPNATFFQPDPITRETALLAVLKGKRPGQAPEAIEFTAKASMGNGREHARFIPVSQCAYRYTLDTDERRINELFEKWLSKAKKIADVKGLEEAQRKDLRAEYETMEIDRCYVMDKNGEPNSFDFTVESIGTMDPYQIVKRALIVATNILARYVNLDKQALPADLRVQPAANRLEGFDFLFQAQDHTLGNLLQSYIDLFLMDGSKVTYVGYNVPHPLRDEMVLRLGIAGGQEADARKVIAEAARGCSALFRGFLEAWERATGAGPSAAPKPQVVVKGRVKASAAAAKAPTGAKKSGTIG
jgi:DNA-directed RNA polymerase subunit L/DNA-directed RNA polymerase alpha subunit